MDDSSQTTASKRGGKSKERRTSISRENLHVSLTMPGRHRPSRLMICIAPPPDDESWKFEYNEAGEKVFSPLSSGYRFLGREDFVE